jgi:F420-dependent oxidoreductase-like protein
MLLLVIPIGLALELPSPSVANAVDDLIQRARSATDAGMASLWLGQVYDLDALTALAVIARHVSDVALGSAVTTIHSRHPIAMSSQAQTAQAASGGRLRLGLGVGHRAAVEQRYGVRFDHPAQRMREYLQALLPLLSEGQVAFHGQTVSADTSGWPAKVAGATPAPPVLIAALGPAMLRVAGELADGTITWLAGPRTIAEHISPAIRAASRGRLAPQIVVGLPICVTSDPAAARARAAASLSFYANVPSYRGLLDREGADSPADVAIIGTETQVEQQLNRLASAGATHFIANPSGITTDRERARTIGFLGALSARPDPRNVAGRPG